MFDYFQSRDVFRNLVTWRVDVVKVERSVADWQNLIPDKLGSSSTRLKQFPFDLFSCLNLFD